MLSFDFFGLISFGTSHAPASVFIILGAGIAVVSAVLYFAMGIRSEHDHWYGDPSKHYYDSPGGAWENGFSPLGGWTQL